MKIKCKCCGRLIPARPNVKNQKYCGSPRCQKERRRLWRKNKMKTDPDYRTNKSDSQKRWAAKNPDYWKNYRAKNPEYANRNREQQQVRNHELQGSVTSTSSVIAKSDASSAKTIVKSGYYRLIPATREMIAKSDALIVKIDMISGGYT